MAAPASSQLIDELGLTDTAPEVFLRSEADLDAAATPLPHAHAVRRAWRKLNLSGVVYLDRSPAVYLKEVKVVRDADARRWHRRLWNHGVAPILAVADPKAVHIYSGWSAPASADEEAGAENRLVRTFDRVADALELQQLIHSVETGRFYTEHTECFDRENAVDRQLLRYLELARGELTKGEDALPGPDADALLTRTIFVCYLIAREIISGEHYPDTKLSTIEKHGGLQKLVADVPETEAPDLLFDLFGRLKGTFNGSLFDTDLEQERRRVTQRHIRVVQKFLRRDDPRPSGQLSLGFPAYDFSIIPIETISAIYEKFIEAGDEKARRQTGAYYTPPHLVELVVDQAVEGWESLLDQRVLDPACGSGIFLVSMFNRMAEEWRRKNPGVRNTTRAKALTEILEHHLCGLDVNETACRIATFSLYLALLDQLEPRDIQELQKTDWQLPRLLGLPDKRPSGSDGRSVIQGNLFAPDVPVAEGSFDLVVGNPPWVSRGASTDPAFLRWVDDNPDKPVPEKQMAHGFMWHALDFLKPGARACLVLPSAVLLNKTSNEFQQRWFQRFAVERVTDLSDLSFLLFVGSKRPAVVVRFRNEQPALDQARLDYDAPKADPQSLRGGPVRVYEPDRWQITQDEVVRRAGEDKAPLVWKERLWGTPRDLRFLERLMDMPRLGNLVASPSSRRPKRWIKGKGFQPYNPEERDPKTGEPLEPLPSWWSDDDRFIDARAEFGLVLLPRDTCRAGDVKECRGELRRSPDERLFAPPMLIANDGFTKVAFCDFPVLFRDSMQSIAGPREDDGMLRFLAAVLNSELAWYFLFHTACSWGTERDRVRLFEILRLPFPLPEQTADPARGCAIVAEVSERLERLQADAGSAGIGRRQLVDQAKRDLDSLIVEYYDIDPWEHKLIRDTMDVLERSSTPAGPSSRVPTLSLVTEERRRKYADVLCSLLNKWGEGSGYAVNASVTWSWASSLAVVTLRKSNSPLDYEDNKAPDKLNEALARIASLLPEKRAGVEMVRGMKVFDKDTLHIVKPLMLRFWTETAAMNDADEIAAAILRKG